MEEHRDRACSSPLLSSWWQIVPGTVRSEKRVQCYKLKPVAANAHAYLSLYTLVHVQEISYCVETSQENSYLAASIVQNLSGSAHDVIL